jgi:hypothetical protein
VTPEELRAAAGRVIAEEHRRSAPDRLARLDQLAALSRERGDDGARLLEDGLHGMAEEPDGAVVTALAYIGAVLVLQEADGGSFPAIPHEDD